jgi:large subunit ribosomal protein L13
LIRGAICREFPLLWGFTLGNIRASKNSRLIMKTYSAKKETAKHNWYVVDATDKTLGRMATEIANRLRGKHKPEFTPHVDTGDYVVVVNAEKVKVSGNKTTDKMYYHHTGFPGGIKSISFDKLIDKAPERAIEFAVKGMMPKNKLSRAMLSKLKVYSGSEHPHQAQQPQLLEI